MYYKIRKMSSVESFTKRQMNSVLKKFEIIIPYIIGKITKYGIANFLISPLYYCFIMFVIRPNAVRDSSVWREIIEISITVLAEINVTGNILINFYTDTSLKRYFSHEDNVKCISGHNNEVCEGIQSPMNHQGYRFCEKCNAYQVARSWHCKKCDVCIVDRDYHCVIFSQCVGRYTRRYYILSCVYIILTLIYATYYTFKYDCGNEDSIKHVYDSESSIFSYFPFFLLIADVKQSGFGCWTPLITFLMNTCITLLVLALLVINIYLAMNDLKIYESKIVRRPKVPARPRRRRRFFQCMEDIFGVRWYWAIFWPFVSSPIPKYTSN